MDKGGISLGEVFRFLCHWKIIIHKCFLFLTPGKERNSLPFQMLEIVPSSGVKEGKAFFLSSTKHLGSLHLLFFSYKETHYMFTYHLSLFLSPCEYWSSDNQPPNAFNLATTIAVNNERSFVSDLGILSFTSIYETMTG